jgi:hypothetical protein
MEMNTTGAASVRRLGDEPAKGVAILSAKEVCHGD